MKKIKNSEKSGVDHSQFINKDGYRTGGVEIETTNATETQTFHIKGQKGMLAEKKRNAKLY